ncbi:alginate lyase family protein [Spirosoma linguale]|uniref:Heparinase II/III family protein n=1 Tax=Spirosoma linguale (strain ATCC 33905 / DSM 74 / LMG 10896 / Claus 1) TaxID=504472 RepID=D2QJL0_SPILD|nr:Heparinase II/III family protein [Spirosoma linguale DSM 74]
MNKPGLVWRTVRHLTMRQMVFQLLSRIRTRPRLRFSKITPATYFLTVPEAAKPVTYRAGVFTLLNRTYAPETGAIDWNGRHPETAGYGKLWTYHLNYFDFLNQPGLLPKTGLALIHDFIYQSGSLRDGLEPYPTSLRVMNWIQFLSRHQLQDKTISRHLVAQMELVSRRVEYHIGGNHLLENGFSLLLGALYYRNKRWFAKGSVLVQAELRTQILADGGHYERSPMYHQVLLDQLLTVLLALQADDWHRGQNATFADFLARKAHQMSSWLDSITFRNGDVPMVSDSAFGIAPATNQLRKKAAGLWPVTHNCGIEMGNSGKQKSTDTGYRMFRQDRYELCVDVGSVGPSEQPGHAHADTFSFVLYADGVPLIVDSATSTYELGPRRAWERSTAAHNTVEVNGINSSEVWASFRVGRRARVIILYDAPDRLTARHDGYRHLGLIHERAWSMEPTGITISDQLLSLHKSPSHVPTGVARFHVHPAATVQITGQIVRVDGWMLAFVSEAERLISLESYAMAEGFNQLQPGYCIRVDFRGNLKTALTLVQ